MATPRSVRFVWSEHARVRELERVKHGVELPLPGSFVRILHLSPRSTVPDDESQWLYLAPGCLVYGMMFSSPDYDVFLIRTVLERSTPLKYKAAPQGVALYQLERIQEQGEEGDEADTWNGYSFHKTCRRRGRISKAVPGNHIQEGLGRSDGNNVYRN